MDTDSTTNGTPLHIVMEKEPPAPTRVQIRPDVAMRAGLAAHAIGVSVAAFISVAIDEYLRNRPDLYSRAHN